jgi:hypothetical protein
MKATASFVVLAGALLLCATAPLQAQPGSYRSVTITAPPNSAVFTAPADIVFRATVFGATPSMQCIGVSFCTNITWLNPGAAAARDTHISSVSPSYYTATWHCTTPGFFQVTAIALFKAPNNNLILEVPSAPISILVGSGPPPTNNVPPTVRITTPANRATFRAPVNIPICAYATDPDDAVSSVEFFDGSASLGLGTRVCVTPLCTNAAGVFPPPTCYYVRVWTNVPAGPHVLTAVATDTRGAAVTSVPVNIYVWGPVPPPTNAVPIVSVVATDPVAIEGTNCVPWLGSTNATPGWSDPSAAVCRYFTNCGPKNALMTVRRAGPTNADLTVSYTLGGTASNGVDYVTLPGSVTIAAGQRSVLITIVPLDDGITNEPNKIVILRLSPDAGYLLGCPSSAAAIIIEDFRVYPVTGVLPGPYLLIGAPGPDGAWFHVEYSTNLRDWVPICSANQVFNGHIYFIDPDALTSKRYYRAVPEAGAPAE